MWSRYLVLIVPAFASACAEGEAERPPAASEKATSAGGAGGEGRLPAEEGGAGGATADSDGGRIGALPSLDAVNCAADQTVASPSEVSQLMKGGALFLAVMSS